MFEKQPTTPIDQPSTFAHASRRQMIYHDRPSTNFSVLILGVVGQ
jgi:hypothetical protein